MFLFSLLRTPSLAPRQRSPGVGDAWGGHCHGTIRSFTLLQGGRRATSQDYLSFLCFFWADEWQATCLSDRRGHGRGGPGWRTRRVCVGPSALHVDQQSKYATDTSICRGRHLMGLTKG